MSTTTTPDIAALDRDFTRTTTLWGNITLGIGFLIATSMPFYIYFTTDIDVSVGQIVAAFLAVAGIFGVFWIVEPVTYFPILGPAGMYQAFMIGNISNKLLPSAIVAQNRIGAVPGTKKASFAATAAICGAALVHVSSMLLFVGILGTWMITLIPTSITEVAQLYILPAVMGGVLVQLVATIKQPKLTIIALIVGAGMVLLVVPNTPPLVGAFQVALCVLITVLIGWFTRGKDAGKPKGGRKDGPQPPAGAPEARRPGSSGHGTGPTDPTEGNRAGIN